MLRDEKANGPRIRNSPFRASYELRGDKLNTSNKATRTEVVLCALFPLITAVGVFLSYHDRPLLCSFLSL